MNPKYKLTIEANLPNILTILRLVSIPIFIGIFYLPFEISYWLCAGLFLLASLTDWFDGFLARRWQQVSRFGTFLDPVADKLVVVVALILLISQYQQMFITIAGLIIICREIVISALREWFSSHIEINSLPVSKLGKWKTGSQMAAIVLLLISQAYRQDIFWSSLSQILGTSLLIIAAILTIYSMTQYCYAAWQRLTT